MNFFISFLIAFGYIAICGTLAMFIYGLLAGGSLLIPFLCCLLNIGGLYSSYQLKREWESGDI